MFPSLTRQPLPCLPIKSFFYGLTLINTAPFCSLIPPGVVLIMLHTCCAFHGAHLYNAGVISRPFICFPANFLVTSAKYATFSFIYTHL